MFTLLMVRVKRGGVFVEVKPGESLGREGGKRGVSVPSSRKDAESRKQAEAKAEQLAKDFERVKAGQATQAQRESVNKRLVERTRQQGLAYQARKAQEQQRVNATTTPAQTTSIQRQQATQSQEAQQREAQNRFLAKYGRSQASPSQRGITTPPQKDTPINRARNKLINTYRRTDEALKKRVTKPIARGASKVSSSLGGPATIQEAKENSRQSTQFLIDKGLNPKLAKTGEFISGAGLGVTEDVINKPAKNVLIYGAGAGIGAGSYGAIRVASSIPKIGGVAGPATKVGIAGAGAYFLAGAGLDTAGKVSMAQTPLEKGSVVGNFGKDVALIGFGAGRGFKGGQQIEGLYRTRGRQYLETEQGVYPSANTKSQLKLFQKNVIPELGDTPGAFHTTGSKFFGKGKVLEPQVGTSELPGLYASTKVSTPFARIPGSSSSPPKLNPFKGLLDVPGTPGIAFLKPTAFRSVKISRKPSVIDGQKFKWSFRQPAKQGVADVPGAKTEIEAIFRREAGNYGFESGKFYTKIDKVRVPIDVFNPEVSPTLRSSTATISTGVQLKGGQSSYTAPSSYSSITGVVKPLIVKTYSVSSTTSTPKTYSLVTTDYGISSSSGGSSYIPKISSGGGSGSSGGSSRGGSSRGGSSRGGSSSSPSSSSPPSSYRPSPPSRGSSSRSYSSSLLSSISSSRSSSSSSSSSLIPSNRAFGFLKFKPAKIKQPRGGFSVSLRRYGKFFSLGSGLTKSQAISRGVKSASTTLGASIKIQGPTQITKIPGFRKSKKEKNVFIEPKRRRLSTKGEIREIIGAKLK